MKKQNGKQESNSSSRNNGLGPVAREKYESILQARIRQCIAVQHAKIETHRAKAMEMYLERNGLASKLATYRTVLEELIGFLGEPDWRSPIWLRDEKALSQESRVEKGVDCILRGMKELKRVYAEIERLRAFESQIAEKVWLAGAPSEIAELLKEIGDPERGSEGAES